MNEQEIKIEEAKKKQEELEGIYKNFAQSENGKIIIKDLEDFILKRQIFFSDDLSTDSLLREGARQLLNYIYYQSNN